MDAGTIINANIIFHAPDNCLHTFKAAVVRVNIFPSSNKINEERSFSFDSNCTKTFFPKEDCKEAKRNCFCLSRLIMN